MKPKTQVRNFLDGKVLFGFVSDKNPVKKIEATKERDMETPLLLDKEELK